MPDLRVLVEKVRADGTVLDAAAANALFRASGASGSDQHVFETVELLDAEMVRVPAWCCVL